ncbi:hypothetical protein [Methylobacterium indicum]|uniref:Uncharacterized protein n=1 Tax=Methylobacterium indicum TaxID=1775910 RepID=A0A8H8X0S2_9HYPH|nr:hypothetical protein [Methylobacterium indicum]BCM87772.1 hypothetical protein mvi_62330 [Methylobacterium indicum]
MQLNRYQKAAIMAYNPDEFGYMLNLTGDALERALKECGDGFFEYIMVELSTSEGCTSLTDAMDRCASMVRDLGRVCEQIELDMPILPAATCNVSERTSTANAFDH